MSYINGIYVAGSVFGSATQIGGTGTYLVYMGNGTSATVTGLSASTTYTFKLYEYNGNAIGLAYLVAGAPVISNSTLPVSLTSFTAQKQNEDVLLKWQTASELNNDYFEIQRSVQSAKCSVYCWEAIGKVKGNGTTNSVHSYQFTDNVMLSGVEASNLYYRLNQFDFDGKSSLSEVRVVNFDQSKNTEWNIYPNPATNELHIFQSAMSNLPTGQAGEQLAVSLFDITGKKVMENILFTNTTTINTSSLVEGMYFVRITDSNGAVVKVQKVGVVR